MAETKRIVSAFEARTHLGELMDYVRYEKRPCFIERHGKAVAALVDIESYEEAMRPGRYQEWLRQAVEQIKAALHPERIILFGSMARGPIKAGSDIDLLIVGQSDLRPIERIRGVLSLLDLENPVEPHVYTAEEVAARLQEGDPFLKRIFDEGRCVYQA